MPQTFLALQCSFCEAFQVTLDKASKKFSCAICCQKQSFKTIHAISNSAKDCRKVVQELNELRGARDRQLGSAETAAALEQAAATAAAAAGCPASGAAQQSLAWEEFAEADDAAALEDDDSWLAGTGEFVTTLPDSSSSFRGKRRSKAADAAGEAVHKQPRYGEGRGKQQLQQQPAQHAVRGAAVAAAEGSWQNNNRQTTALANVPPRPRYQQQLGVPHPQQQQQQQPWSQQCSSWQPQTQQQQEQQQQQQQQSVAAPQHNQAPQQQQQQHRHINGHFMPANGQHGVPVGVKTAQHNSSAASCGATWPQLNSGMWQAQGAAAGRQQQQQQQQPWLQPPCGSSMGAVKQQQQQPWLDPPLGSSAAAAQQQQPGGKGFNIDSRSRAQLQQQQQRMNPKGAGKPMAQPPAAAGAWGAFVDEDDDGPGGCSSDGEECIVDGQVGCCLGFTGPEVAGLQGAAAAGAAGQLGSAAAARWS